MQERINDHDGQRGDKGLRCFGCAVRDKATEFETADQATDIEADYMKKVLLEELHNAPDELEEIDCTIMELYSQNCTETQIGQAVGMSQRGVGKRKQRIFLKLRTRLKDFR